MPYDQHCASCPYREQQHLRHEQQTSRDSPPIELETNGRSTLLLFQAPGTKEWEVGKPIQPTRRRGGTAGARIQESWIRAGKERRDFDILNAVQCFPGNDGGRDREPAEKSITCCQSRLGAILNQKNYTKIIVFGNVASSVVAALTRGDTIKAQIVQAPHPNGGVFKAVLDALW
jgi:uracil-DNA glycosylase family 4